MQPAVRPFHVYTPDINPAIEAEFAHAVYRFGHSMLDDDVARTTRRGRHATDNSLPLLTAFLNPPEFFNGGALGTLHAASRRPARIVMGSSDQVGNELDEFVTETLRNNLLGLPLDLPALNMTRAREAGVPPLNDVRRQIHAETNDGQLRPYTELVRLRSAPQAPRVADQLRRRLRHAPDDHRPPRRWPASGRRPARSSIRCRRDLHPRQTRLTSCSAPAPGTPTTQLERRRRPPASTTSTSGSAASPRSPTCSAACSAARSTTSSRRSSRSCRTATGCTT